MQIDELPQLYKHRTRGDWGLAILAWEGRDKRRYQFQDGKARTFKEGYFGFLEEVDKPVDVTAGIVAELEQKLDLTRARREVIEQAKSDGRELTTFNDQRRIFDMLFEGGFEDPEYVATIRGTDANVRRKGHLDPAIADAAEAFSKERLGGLLEAGDYEAMHASVAKVLNRTSLTSGKAHVGHLLAMPEGRKESFAKAFEDALWGADDFDKRFNRLVTAMSWGDNTPSWQLVTTPLALTHPDRHICVKPSVFRTQAKWMAPRLSHDTVPSGTVYLRYRAMASLIRDRLRDGEQAPRDLLDVYTFIWNTLRPAGRALLNEQRKS